MKITVLACLIAFSGVPLATAHAEGEGSGPSFPGLQVPDVGVTLATGSNGGATAVTTEKHASNHFAAGPDHAPSRNGSTASARRSPATRDLISPD